MKAEQCDLDTDLRFSEAKHVPLEKAKESSNSFSSPLPSLCCKTLMDPWYMGMYVLLSHVFLSLGTCSYIPLPKK